MNLPQDSFSFEVRRQVAMLAAEVSFERVGQQFEELTGVHVALRQVEELTRAAARVMEEFYAAGRADLADEATSDLLVLTADQKGIVMRREQLRPGTRQNAEAARPKLDTRKTKGEKPTIDDREEIRPRPGVVDQKWSGRLGGQDAFPLPGLRRKS